MSLHRPSLALAAVALVAILGMSAAQAQQRQLGPPAGAGLEGTETEPGEKSEKVIDAPPPPSPSPVPSNAPRQPGATGSEVAKDPRRAGMRPSNAAELGRGGNVSDIEIPLDIPLGDIPNYRTMMRDMVQELSRYARARDPKFAILARPGFDLLTWSQREYDLTELQRDPTKIIPVEMIRPAGTPMNRYLQAIDGFVLNGHFCSTLRVPRTDLAAVRALGLKAFAIDTCGTDAQTLAALQGGARAGIVTYAGMDRQFATLPHYRPLPENAANVETLSDARNMLMLLSARTFGSRDAWFNAMQANNYDLLVIDAFDRKDRPLTKDEVHQLKFKQVGARRLVLARVDVGYADETKFYWQNEWQIGAPSWIVGANPEVAGEYATEFWNPAWKAIVGKYLAGIMDLGFDGVMLDGLEAYRRWEAKTPVSVTNSGF